MVTELTIQEFVEQFGYESYIALQHAMFSKIKDTDDFKNNEKNIYIMTVMSYSSEKSDDGSAIVEASCNLVAEEGKIKVWDFGITRIALSDEEMPDEALDRYNELKLLRK